MELITKLELCKVELKKSCASAEWNPDVSANLLASIKAIFDNTPDFIFDLELIFRGHMLDLINSIDINVSLNA